MDNRYRSKGYQQDDRNPRARWSRQDEQLSTEGQGQFGEPGWRTQEDERWQSGPDYDRGYGRNEPLGRGDWSQPSGSYRNDTSSLDDYDRAGTARDGRREMSQPYYHGRPDRSRDIRGYPSRSYGADGYGAAMYDRGYSAIPPRHFDRDDRGFFDRASDEVMSWFGDEDAARRRRMDNREDHRGRGPANYTRSNERLLEEANERLTRDPLIDASKITVTCSDNEVTLDGTVDSRSAKRRAEDIVDDISGVKHVQNNLRVESRDRYYSETSALTES